MNDERRNQRRVRGPFDATWSGHSGAGICRVTDISEGGCFVETWAMPVVGEKVTVSPKLLADAPGLTLEGVVVYHVVALGFAVQFADDADRLEQLRAVLGARSDTK